MKQTHEKVGDHWEPKEENGPSDASAEQGGLNSEDTAGGVDANASKEHLYEIAQELEKIALEDDYFVQRKLYPNVDFYSGLIYEAFQFPPEMFTVRVL